MATRDLTDSQKWRSHSNVIRSLNLTILCGIRKKFFYFFLELNLNVTIEKKSIVLIFPFGKTLSIILIRQHTLNISQLTQI